MLELCSKSKSYRNLANLCSYHIGFRWDGVLLFSIQPDSAVDECFHTIFVGDGKNSNVFLSVEAAHTWYFCFDFGELNSPIDSKNLARSTTLISAGGGLLILAEK